MTESDAAKNERPPDSEELVKEPTAPRESRMGMLRMRLAAAGDAPAPETEIQVAGLTVQFGEGGENLLELPAGEHTVTVVPPEGYEAPSEFTVHGPEGGGPHRVAAGGPVPVGHDAVTELEVILVPKHGYGHGSGRGTVTGSVVDRAGHGLRHVRVVLRLHGGGGILQIADTDRDGVFTFMHVEHHTYTVLLDEVPTMLQGRPWQPPAYDTGERTVTVKDDGTAYVEPIVLEPVSVAATATGVVRGWVRSFRNAAPVKGVRVEAELVGGGKPHRAKTKADGSFTIANLPPGDYRVGISQVQGKGKPQPRPQQPDPGERNATVHAGRTAEVSPILLAEVPATGGVTGSVLNAGTQTGVKGVRVVLQAVGGLQTRVATTNAKGRFKFDRLAEGGYRLLLEQVPSPAQGTTWEPVVADATGGQRTAVVRAGKPHKVDAILVEPERHRIYGTVRTRPDGPAVPFAEVRVRDLRGNQLATVQADVNGAYEFRSPTAGTFLVEFVKDGVSRVDQVVVESDKKHDMFIPDAQVQAFTVTPPTPVQDLGTFPLLTESVSLPQAHAPAGAPPSTVGQTVESALREALGWRPRAGDPRGFSAALAHSFELREVQGHTEVTWTPRTYAAQVQADLGAITGAQASLYSRARVALDAALPLLDGLYPLDPAFDPQNTEAIRSIVRAELNEVVAELGVEGGPRIGRVDELLDLLLGGAVGQRDPASLQGQLRTLQDRFGLDATRVETVEEEQDFTNFLILVDYVRDIDNSWTALRGEFDPETATSPFLGTQLVLISRSLSVVAESVEEVNFTLDSVFIGAAERQTILLKFPPVKPSAGNLPSRPSILLGDLLSWVERVATEEGPQLLQDGGKDGVDTLASVLDTLRELVRRALVTTGGGQQVPGSNDIPDGYATERVQRALRELAKYLDDTFKLADKIQPPAARLRG